MGMGELKSRKSRKSHNKKQPRGSNLSKTPNPKPRPKGQGVHEGMVKDGHRGTQLQQDPLSLLLPPHRRQHSPNSNKYEKIKGLLGIGIGTMAVAPLIKDFQGVTRYDRTKPGPYIPKQFNPENVGSRMLFKNMIRVQGNNNTSYRTECNHPTDPGQCRFIKKGEPNVVHNMRESRVDKRQDVIERAHKGAPLYNQYIHIHIPNGFISPDYTTYTVPLKMNLIMHAGAGNTVKYENSLENGRGVFARNKAKMLKHELPFAPHLVHNGGEPVVNTQFNIRQGNKTKLRQSSQRYELCNESEQSFKDVCWSSSCQ